MAPHAPKLDTTALIPDGLIHLLHHLGEALREIPRENRSASSKNQHGETITGADLKTQRVLASFLHQRHPDHLIVGEEQTDHPCLTEFSLPLDRDRFYWTIDPIDGTTNWSSGKDTYAITVGLQRGNAPILGIVYFPATDTLVAGGEGLPTKVNGQPVGSPKAYDPQNIVINYGLGKRKTLAEREAFTTSLGAITEQLHRPGCASASILDIITGKADAYLSLKEAWTNICPLYAILKNSGFYINIAPATLDLNEPFALAIATREFAARHLDPASRISRHIRNSRKGAPSPPRALVAIIVIFLLTHYLAYRAIRP